MPSNELNLADFQKIIFLNNIEESSEISDINNIFKYGENSNEKFDFAVFFTEQDKSNIQNLDNAEQYPNKIINIWNKGQRLNRFIGIDKQNNIIRTEVYTYKLLFGPDNGLISVIDQKKQLYVKQRLGYDHDNYNGGQLETVEVIMDNKGNPTSNYKQFLDPSLSSLIPEIKWESSNSSISLEPNKGSQFTEYKLSDSVSPTLGKFKLETTSNVQTPDQLNKITLNITWYCLNGTVSSPFECDSSHIFSTDITARLTGYTPYTITGIRLVKDAECPLPNEIKLKIIEADKEYTIQNWPNDKRKTDYTGTNNLQLTDWSLKPGTYNIITIAPAIEGGNDSLKITVNEITPTLAIGSNSSSLIVYDANTNNTISKYYDGTALYATVSIEDPTNHLQSINRQFNGTITYWEDGNNNKIYEVQYVGVPLKLDGVSITNIVGNKNSTKLHVRFTPNRSDNTYIYYGAIQNAEITLQLKQKQTTLSLNGIETTYDGNNHYITGKPSITGTIRYKQYTNIPANPEDLKEDLKSHGNSLPGAVAGRNCNLSGISPTDAGSYYIAAYLDPDDDNYADSDVVISLITIKKANTSLVFNGSSNTYNGSKQGGFTIKITATPAVEGKLYYSTSQDLSNASTADVKTSHYTGFITATVSVTLPSNMQQTEVGNYPIYVKFIPNDTHNYNESTVNGTFSIIQVSAEITISNYSAKYNGLKQGYIRVTPTLSGKVYYGLSKNNMPYHKDFDASKNSYVDLNDSNIQVKHVNTSSPQYVYIQFEPTNTNYKKSNIYTATITINKVKPTLTLSASTIKYSNTANKASATVTGMNSEQMTGTVYYIAGDVIKNQSQAHQKKYNKAAITLDNVSQTDVGSIKLTAQFAPDNTVRDGVKLSDDYELSDQKSITITVIKVPQDPPIATGDTQKYPNGVEATASGGGQQGSLIWVDADNGNETSNKITVNTAPTSKNVQAYWSGNNNYEPSPKSNIVKIEITKGTPIIPPGGSYVVTFNESKLTYDGTKKVLINTKITSFNGINGTIYWYVSTSSTTPTWSTAANSGWSLEIPSKIEPGTYYVWYYVELSNLYNDPGTFYNTVTKVTETTAAPDDDGYETDHKTIHKIAPTIKINGTTVALNVKQYGTTSNVSPITGYTGTYSGNNQGSFTFTSSAAGSATYDVDSSHDNGTIGHIDINANQTYTIDAGNEFDIKNADTYRIDILFHPSDRVHYVTNIDISVDIIINPKKLDKPVLTAHNVTYGDAYVGQYLAAQPLHNVYKVYIGGGQNAPDIFWIYRQPTGWVTSSSVPLLKEAGSMVVKAMYKNSVNGVVDNNWESSDESDEITVIMYKRTVTITPPEFTTETLTYNLSGQYLLKSGTGSCTTGGTMYYYFSMNNATTPMWNSVSPARAGWYSGSNPSGWAAGTYYVWWYCYVPDTDNNTGTNINTVNRISGYKSINKATPYINPVPERVGDDHSIVDSGDGTYWIWYNGNYQDLLKGGAAQHSSTNNVNVPGTFQYEQGRNITIYQNPHWWFTPSDTSNYKSVDGSVNGRVGIFGIN